MRRLLAPAVGAAAVCLVLAGCSGGEDGPSFTVPAIGPADVDVDTPALRQAKAAAGVEDCPDVEAAEAPVTGGLPQLTLECFGGGPSVDLASLRGPLAINIWAQWCTPCRNEIPELQAFHERYGDRVPLIGIDYQDIQADDAMDFLADRGATYPQLADPGAATDGIGERPRIAPPTMILVDEDGVVAFAAPKVVESPEDLRDLVEEHLGVDL